MSTTQRIRKIPYRHPCFDAVTKRIDLFQLEQHLARSTRRTDLVPVLTAPPDDDFETRVTMPREAVSLPPPAPPVYPLKARDPADLVVILIVVLAVCAMLSVLIY